MAETPEQFFARTSAAGLRTPPVQEWASWPFEGGVTPKALVPPAPEPPRMGVGGVDCEACARPDADCFWTDERWRLLEQGPGGLPFVCILEPRVHIDAPGDADPDFAREMGWMIARVEQAVRAIGHIERVHVSRFGDGAEHMHWWFIARPADQAQFAMMTAVIWDDVLPLVPQDVWDDNKAAVAAAMDASR
jgi:diadenosine tetraphosphate (Ap4A) HIT family hydrolase